MQEKNSNIRGIEGKKFCEAYYDENGKMIFDTGHSKIDLESLVRQAYSNKK